jgi:hypothetical protein
MEVNIFEYFCATFKKCNSLQMNKKIFSFYFLQDWRFFPFLCNSDGCGDFIESKYNTDTARILIYNAWWFEAIMVFCD